ncbi:hypothetical protein D3C85_1202660 [compost metagenome]
MVFLGKNNSSGTKMATIKSKSKIIQSKPKCQLDLATSLPSTVTAPNNTAKAANRKPGQAHLNFLLKIMLNAEKKKDAITPPSIKTSILSFV